VAIASEVKLVDITASAKTPGARVSTALWENCRSTLCAARMPPTSTMSGITTARSSCSPLRSSSRVSIRVWAST
jgi:hypothetical protein